MPAPFEIQDVDVDPQNMNNLWRRLLFLIRRRKFDSELGDEMHQHIEMRAQKLMNSGIAPKEARYRAQREFGNTFMLKEDSRGIWQWRPLETVLAGYLPARRAARVDPMTALRYE